MYIAKDSPLHQLNPLTKATLFLMLVWVAFVAPGVFPSLAILALVVLPLAVTAGLLKNVFKLCLQLVVPVAGVLFLVQGLFFPGAGERIPLVGPLTLRPEGIMFAFLTTARLLVMAASFSLLLMATHPGHLMSELVRVGLPPSIAYVVITSLLIVPEMGRKAGAILEAQRARGLRTAGNVFQRARALLPLVAPLILSTVVSVEDRSIALEARAFNVTARTTSWEAVPDSRVQRGVRWGCALVTLLTGAARLWQ